jgi:protein-tyrosine phosphatase
MNLRDMGGYPVNGSITIWKRVLRGDNPNRLTPESVQALVEYGLRTVIDLRHQDEANDPTNPFVPGGPGAAAGVTLHSIPLMDVVTYEANPVLKAGPHSSAWSIAMLETFGPNIACVMRTMALAPKGAVLFHCHLGKDRTGLIGQLLLSSIGADEDVVREDYLQSNPCLEPWFDEIRTTHAPTPEKLVEVNDWLHHWMYAPAEMVPGTIAYLVSQYGSAKNYLKHIGLTGFETDALVARLLV